MLLFKAALAAIAFLTAVGTANADHWVYIGTYTGAGKDDSKGIYRAKLNDKTGELTELKLAAEVTSPSFLAISPNNKFLYAVGETTQVGDKKEGTVHAYAIDGKTGELTKLNDEKTGGSGPCYIAVNNTGKYAIAANYGAGSTALFSLKADGSFDKQCDYFEHTPPAGKKALGHCATFFADPGTTETEFAYAVDAGLDRVYMFKLDTAKGKLVPQNPPFIALPDKCAPRHIAFNTNTGKAYVCGERNSTINTLRHDRNTGLLETWKQESASVSTLPKDATDELRKKNSTAEVVVHPSKGFAFVSNRGHDTLAVFKLTVESTTFDGFVTGAGENSIKTPRNFNIAPNGHWILVANQDGGTVRVVDWTPEGSKMTGIKVDVKNPVCVKFVPVLK